MTMKDETALTKPYKTFNPYLGTPIECHLSSPLPTYSGEIPASLAT